MCNSGIILFVIRTKEPSNDLFQAVQIVVNRIYKIVLRFKEGFYAPML